MELLFSNQQLHSIEIPSTYIPSSLSAAEAATALEKPSDIRYLIHYLKTNLLEDKDRYELFSVGESIRPGILILINSADWELEGELEYVLREGDEVVFISTLHGG